MELSIDQALQQGVAAHKEGRLQDAERCYRSILQVRSDHPDANHNLGLLAVSVGKLIEAIPLFKMALTANPRIEQFWLSYIDVLIKLERFDDANQALIDCGHSDISAEKLDFLNRQLQASKSRNANEAVKKQTLSEKRKKLAGKKKNKRPQINSFGATPSDDQRNQLLGHYQAGRYTEAEELAVSLTQNFPRHLLGWKVLGAVYKQTDRLEESLIPMQKSVELSPQDAEVHSNLGATLKDLGRLEEAEASLTQAIRLRPDFAEAHYNLGLTFKELGRLTEAEASYTRAIKFRPNFARALISRSYLLIDKGEYEAALSDADACILDAPNKALPLASLYALSRKSEIYKRLADYSKTDPNNMSLAAFSAFFSAVERKPTEYNFCSNPFDFIHTSNFSTHVSDVVSYTEDIIDELSQLETIWQPAGKLTINGFQTPDSLNVLEVPTGKIAKLRSIILLEIDAYYSKFQNEEGSYIQEFPSTRNLFGWTVTLKHQGHQKSHIHANGWLSGVIYLKVVPSQRKNEGAISFSLNGEGYSDGSSPDVTFQPALGDIVLFPSSLYHKTIPFTAMEDRVIIAFDLKPGT